MLPAIEMFSKTPRLFLAPMAGITDVVFRRLMRELGAEVVISELISAEGLVRGGQKTLDLARIALEERPVGVQIFGSDIDVMVEAAKRVEGMGADFVDINFGCPVKKVVCDGGGAAWLRDPIALSKLLRAMTAAIAIPLTIKIRTGWDETSRNAREVVQIAAESGVSWVAIHGRTRAQGYAGLADWDLIRAVAQDSPIPIIGNGDVVSAAIARKRLEDGDAHAIMIGRGALKNPWIFADVFGAAAARRGFLEIIERHFELALLYKDRQRAFLSLKKFMGWYAAGFRFASTFRASIFSTHDIDELKRLAVDYFSSLESLEKHDDGTPFLMGGHG